MCSARGFAVATCQKRQNTTSAHLLWELPDCGICEHPPVCEILSDEILGEFEIARLKGFYYGGSWQLAEKLVLIEEILLRNSKDLVGTPRTLELISGAIRRFNYSISMLESTCRSTLLWCVELF